MSRRSTSEDHAGDERALLVDLHHLLDDQRSDFRTRSSLIATKAGFLATVATLVGTWSLALQSNSSWALPTRALSVIALALAIHVMRPRRGKDNSVRDLLSELWGKPRTEALSTLLDRRREIHDADEASLLSRGRWVTIGYWVALSATLLVVAQTVVDSWSTQGR